MKIKVFLSWSEEPSKTLAEIFRQWLPRVMQGVKPFYSAVDIARGLRWSAEVARELAESKVGLLFLTPKNLESPWLMFEAGALSKNIENSKVCPILFGLKPSQVLTPLMQFQLTVFEREEIRQVVKMINEELGEDRLESGEMNKSFDVWWPELEKDVGAALARQEERPAAEHLRSQSEVIEEILKLSRFIASSAFGAGKAENLELEAAFRDLSIHDQIFMFLDGVARQRTWTFYPPREGETELGESLGHLVAGLIKSEKGKLSKRLVEWLQSKNDNLVYFASEVIGYFDSDFTDLKEYLPPIYKGDHKGDHNAPLTRGQLNCLWAHARLTTLGELNQFLLKTGNEENQRWILVAYEQMVRADDPEKRADAKEFIPTLEEFIGSDATDSVVLKAADLLKQFKAYGPPTQEG